MTWELLLTILLVAAIVVAAVAWWRRATPPGAAPSGSRSAPAAGRDEPVIDGDEATIRLDVAARTTDAPAVARLVQGAAADLLRRAPDVSVVHVLNRDGEELESVPRHAAPAGPVPPDTRPDADEPPPQPPRPDEQEQRSPEPVRATPSDEPVPHRSVAGRFDLPASVREILPADPRAVDIVRAIFDAAGIGAEVDGDLIRVHDTAIVVVGGEDWGSASDALGRAFLQFQGSGAKRGVVVVLGSLDPRDVSRREALAKNVRYVGPEAIQRMADAVGAGGNPLDFALPPGEANERR